MKINGKPSYVKTSLDASLSRLKFDTIDLRKTGRLDENAKAADMNLDAATLKKINEFFPAGLAAGATLL